MSRSGKPSVPHPSLRVWLPAGGRWPQVRRWRDLLPTVAYVEAPDTVRVRRIVRRPTHPSFGQASRSSIQAGAGTPRLCSPCGHPHLCMLCSDDGQFGWASGRPGALLGRRGQGCWAWLSPCPPRGFEPQTAVFPCSCRGDDRAGRDGGAASAGGGDGHGRSVRRGRRARRGASPRPLYTVFVVWR